MMRQRIALAFVANAALVLFFAADGRAQSGASRPRRVNPTPVATPTPAPSRNETNAPVSDAARNSTATTSTARPAANAANGASTGSTARAFTLYQQKLYDAALREAKQAAASDPNNSEAFKVAGFAGVALRKYEEAAADLQRALDLQRAAGEEDPNTVAELAQTYVRIEKFEQALPLLVAATTRTGATPDAGMLFFRGLAEYRTGKAADAERSFNAAVKLDPKNSLALFYLGRMALERKDNDAAVNLLNRATTADPRLAEAWTLLTHAYLRRAAAAPATAATDRLGAVRASEALARLRPDEASAVLHAQVLIQSEQFVRAAAALERFATVESAQGQTLYLLGLSHSRAKNFPKAAAALERAAAKSSNDVNIYRELGYVYHSSKQYAKALAAYERGLQLAPDDADLKAAAEQVRPFANK